MARAGEEDLETHYTATFRTHPPPQAAGTLYFPMDVDDLPAAGGSRPDRLLDVSGPQERVQRHTVEQIILAPMLDVLVPLMEEQLLVDAFAQHDIQLPEQVIEVPKILIDELSVRTPVREPQLAEQLVEVPRIISSSSLQRIVEQNVDAQVPRGGVRGLQGFPPGHCSTALPVEQIVDIPVLHGESLHGFLPGHGSAASSSSSHVPAGAADEPFQGFFSRFSPGQKKVRHNLRALGRNCLRTRAHGLRQLMPCRRSLRRRCGRRRRRRRGGCRRRLPKRWIGRGSF